MPTAFDHVSGRIAPVDIEAFVTQRREQPSGATTGVEDGIAEMFSVQVELGCVEVDGCPVIGDETVMPCGLCVQGHSFA
jgi:hypothetical protein